MSMELKCALQAVLAIIGSLAFLWFVTKSGVLL